MKSVSQAVCTHGDGRRGRRLERDSGRKSSVFKFPQLSGLEFYAMHSPGSILHPFPLANSSPSIFKSIIWLRSLGSPEPNEWYRPCLPLPLEVISSVCSRLTGKKDERGHFCVGLPWIARTRYTLCNSRLSSETEVEIGCSIQCVGEGEEGQVNLWQMRR